MTIEIIARNIALGMSAILASLSAVPEPVPEPDGAFEPQAVAQEPRADDASAPFDIFEGAPAGFIAPPLHPEGIRLATQELAPGVYALLSGHPGVDNSGFIVGDDKVLVIDAHINAAMARQIQDAVRAVTDKPIAYLVNTNYHGDHTFGNDAFPAETTIIAHRATAERMRHIDHEKQQLLVTVGGDADVFAGSRLRLPDLTFEERLDVDLGGRTVELWHFGRGNTPGDTVVYVRDSMVAWTGNLVLGVPVPPIFEGGTRDYLRTIGKLASTLDVDTIVPGHGGLASRAILATYQGYLTGLLGSVRDAIDRGLGSDQAVAELTLPASMLPPVDSEMAPFTAFIRGLHQMNVYRTYQDLVRADA